MTDYNSFKNDAVRWYCGSYTLIRNVTTLKLYRIKEDDIPIGYVKVEPIDMVYDKDGFLLSRYWDYPRLDNE